LLDKFERVKRCLNSIKAKMAARKAFPDEEWIDTITLKLMHESEDFVLPDGIKRIKVAKSRLTGLKDDDRILVKEIRQGKILADKGATIFLLPKLKGTDGMAISGPDALVNGKLYEFKNITGCLDRVEIRFRQSRVQCNNIYLKIDSPIISKCDVISKIKNTLKDKKYTGGTKGTLIFYLAQTQEIYLMKIKDLK